MSYSTEPRHFLFEQIPLDGVELVRGEQVEALLVPIWATGLKVPSAKATMWAIFGSWT